MLSRTYLPWTKEEDERLRAFVAQGASVIRAAAALRRSTINVRAHARAVGCPFPSLRIEQQTNEVRH
jgi:GcrA cell cycle regulator